MPSWVNFRAFPLTPTSFCLVRSWWWGVLVKSIDLRAGESGAERKVLEQKEIFYITFSHRGISEALAARVLMVRSSMRYFIK